MNLQDLFSEEIISQKELDPGYANHGSDVWEVETEKGVYIARSSKLQEVTSDPFWWGCHNMFGIDPRKVSRLKKVNDLLREASTIPVPDVLEVVHGEREWAIVEKLEGSTLQSFTEARPVILEQAGKGLAHIHKRTFDYAGHPSQSVWIPLPQFHHHLEVHIEKLLALFYRGDLAIEKLWRDEIKPQLERLRVPTSASMVLIDIDPTQFLTDGSQLTGLVDTEAYALAPRAFDLIGLEYVLDEESADSFAKGYESVMPLPDLTECRSPYRFLYRLLEVQGDDPMEEWLDHPAWFG
ncbi:aminoglycoside phosphotransferase family protein [Halobacillus litoralis]|uniref:phosphotransferase n=1 Tax=Halobacillus litoralis TaxID=45668 RepID=UPI001CD2801E|nr:phosphotransferase [Halobacillus litoralis]MCA0970468.1 aminoglycoside phosphotransferase family protein [Halobacillus litoralis]